MINETQKQLKSHEEQMDLLANKLLEHDEQLSRIEENMATKSDVREIMDTLDVLVKLAKKEEQELTFMGSRVNRMETDVEKIKPLVGFVS